MERGRIPDTAFATAYAQVTDRKRAWIKTGLAAVYAALGGPLPILRQSGGTLGHDLAFSRIDIPLDFVLILCGPDFSSPARLMAAVVPALCARVSDVAVVRIGSVWPKPLLTTLELCGVETVCRLGMRALPGLLAELPQKGRGALVMLDDIRLPACPHDAIRLFSARIAGRAGVFPIAHTAFDAEALAFAHPDMTFFVHGEASDALSVFPSGQENLAEAAHLDYDAVYADAAHQEAALRAAPLVLGPGRETFWLWPHLSPEAFRHCRVTASVDTRGLQVFPGR